MDELDDQIKELRAKIEKLAPFEHRKDRKDFYRRLNGLPRDKARDILLVIFGCLIASNLQINKEEKKAREKARKRYEYIQRCHTRGKFPKINPPDPQLLVSVQPPHRKKDITILNLWDLYETLKELNRAEVSLLRRKTSNMRYFIRQEIIAEILYYFLGIHLESDSIKREISRLKKDPYLKTYIEFKSRSE